MRIQNMKWGTEHPPKPLVSRQFASTLHPPTSTCAHSLLTTPRTHTKYSISYHNHNIIQPPTREMSAYDIVDVRVRYWQRQLSQSLPASRILRFCCCGGGAARCDANVPESSGATSDEQRCWMTDRRPSLYSPSP